jgi:hypothetical protein
MHRFLVVLIVTALLAQDPDIVARTRTKLALIEDDQAEPGAVIAITSQELNAWVRAELAEEPDIALREPNVELGHGTVSFEALADLAKLANGEAGIFARLLEGERRVKVEVEPETKAGKVTIHLKRVELSGIPLSGVILTMAAKLVLSRVYDETEIDAPFAMGHNIDHAVIEPTQFRVYIRK